MSGNAYGCTVSGNTTGVLSNGGATQSFGMNVFSNNTTNGTFDNTVTTQ